MPSPLRLCIVQPRLGEVSETFLQAQAERLPCETTIVHGKPPQVDGRTVLSNGFPARAMRKVWRTVNQLPWHWENQHAYATAFRRHRAQVVLAQYGPTGARVVDACREANVPLVVQFHGYDASMTNVIERYRADYGRIFEHAAGVVAVSRAMRDRLESLGADPQRLYWNPYGVDVHRFHGANPSSNPPRFLAVGRFVDKKAPQMSIQAFKPVADQVPEARLVMIGDGALLDECRQLVSRLGLDNSVELLGGQPHTVVQEQMQGARCFVQHSVTAPSGDCEGTPNSVLEASASGLPVISTRHAGIPDVIVEHETGLLVDERDVEGMSEHMLRIAQDAELADRLGSAGRDRVVGLFSMNDGINRLWQILNGAATGTLPTPEAVAPEPLVPCSV